MRSQKRIWAAWIRGPVCLRIYKLKISAIFSSTKKHPPALATFLNRETLILQVFKVPLSRGSAKRWGVYLECWIKLLSNSAKNIGFEPCSQKFVANHSKIARKIFGENTDEALKLAIRAVPKNIFPLRLELVDADLKVLPWWARPKSQSAQKKADHHQSQKLGAWSDRPKPKGNPTRLHSLFPEPKYR